MRIVLTGGAGFIGGHLSRRLARRGDRVTVFDPCLPPAHPDGGAVDLPHEVELIRSDPRCDADRWRQAIRGADALVHLAALTGTGESMYRITEYTHVNAGLTAWLAQELVARRVTPTRVVYASTRAVYGDGVAICRSCGRGPLAARRATDLAAGRFAPRCATCGAASAPAALREDDPTAPLTPYAMTKAYGEDVLRFASRVTDIPAVSLRLFNVYGSGQPPSNPYVGVVSAFARNILDDRRVPVYEDGLLARDLVHVDDVVEAFVAAIDRTPQGATICNVGSGHATTLLDLVATLGAVAGRQPRVEVTGEARLGDPRSVHADLSHVQRTLGWQPRTSLAAGLAELLTWLRWMPRGEVATKGQDRAREELTHHGLLVAAARIEGVPA